MALKIQDAVDKVVKEPFLVWDFIQGNIRYWIYSRKVFGRRVLSFLLSKKVKKAYKSRLKDARPCYLNGECLHCGCRTPQLFFSDRGCKKPTDPCYLDMNTWTNRIRKKIQKLCGKKV